MLTAKGAWMGWMLLAMVWLHGDYPRHDATKRVHDFADILPAETLVELERVCQEVERATTAQLAVVTVPSLQNQTVEEYATGLFNEWGIGRRETNNGVLLLVAPLDRRLRIEVGYGLEPLLTDQLCGEIRDDYLLPAFRIAQYEKGILDGTRAIARVLLENKAKAEGVKGSGPFYLRTKGEEARVAVLVAAVAGLIAVPLGIWLGRRRSYSSFVFVLLVVVLAILVIAAIYFTFRARATERPLAFFGGAIASVLGSLAVNGTMFKRFGPRGCSKCGAWLELLSEQEDDPKLESVQRLEEQIGSVDYDVWFCPACLNEDTQKYINYFSSFQECPYCHARTFKEGPMEVVSPATYLSDGRGQVEGRCVSCNKKRLRRVELPRLAQSGSGGSSSGGGSSASSGSSGGGGSSFGGGSSGGGGASGRW